MIFNNTLICPYCGKIVHYYDTVDRKVKKEFGNFFILKIYRYKCDFCNTYHRLIPDCIIPYKQYSKEIIFDFIDDVLDNNCLEYENYPSELTIKNWKNARKMHLL